MLDRGVGLPQSGEEEEEEGGDTGGIEDWRVWEER